MQTVYPHERMVPFLSGQDRIGERPLYCSWKEGCACSTYSIQWLEELQHLFAALQALCGLLRLVGTGCLQAAPTDATRRSTRSRPLETALMGDQRRQSEQLQRFRFRHKRKTYLSMLESH